MATVLVVDDAKFMRTMLVSMLTDFGHTIIAEADNGEVGVDLYKRLHPDIVTMDITMPVKDGISAVKEIMAYDPSAKIIMVSAMGQKPFIIDAIQSGAKDFLVKPFQRDRVKETIEKLIGGN